MNISSNKIKDEIFVMETLSQNVWAWQRRKSRKVIGSQTESINESIRDNGIYRAAPGFPLSA